MPKKPMIENKKAGTYSVASSGWNNAINLRRSIKGLMKVAPEISKKSGLTQRDVIAAQRIEVKIHKIMGHIMSGGEVE